MDDLVREFLVESNENLDRVDTELVKLEAEPELVLARNQIVQYASQQDDTGFLATIQQLDLVTSELREGVMKTRMQPISDRRPR